MGHKASILWHFQSALSTDKVGFRHEEKASKPLTRCWQFKVWLVCATATRQRERGQDKGGICHSGLPQKISQILGQETVFKQTCCFSQNIFFSHILQEDPHFLFSEVTSLGRGKGPEEEAGVNLIGLPEQNVTDWRVGWKVRWEGGWEGGEMGVPIPPIACTTEIHFLFFFFSFSFFKK